MKILRKSELYRFRGIENVFDLKINLVKKQKDNHLLELNGLYKIKKYPVGHNYNMI